jgi:competence protein ComEA
VKKVWWAALCVLLGLFGTGLIWLASSPPRGNPIQLIPPPTAEPLQVHVTGEVNQPGVYELPIDSRVYDAVQAAGGFTLDANAEAINLAAPLEDGQQVRVPSKISNQEPDLNQGEEEGFRSPPPIYLLININTASQEVLETLPEIGPVTAENIISYRQNEGAFTQVEEIQKVPGIGPITYEAIKDLITVGDP